MVNDLAEQDVLEQLLENSKPDDGHPALHYLLSTPFRYPPLPWGSRFGAKHSRGLLYGSLSLATCAAETAYYRLVLWYGMAIAPPSGHIRSEHNAFTARYSSRRAIRLQLPPFNQHAASLQQRHNYKSTQLLGSNMRDAGVALFEFVSARCANGGLNVALLEPAGLQDNQPGNLSHWLCETNADHVAFKQIDASGSRYFAFNNEQFLVNGTLPLPAA